MNIIQRGPTPNGTLGALPSSAIRYYVAHTCEGGFEGSVAWLCNEDSLVSAHAVIREDGMIAQLAAWDDVCWHAGITYEPSTPLYVPGVNPNRVSRGLEFAGWAVRPLTPEQIAAGVELIRFWRALDGWVVPLVPHSALATGGPNMRRDPGVANLAAIEAALEDDMDQDRFDAMALDWWKRPAGLGGAGGLDTVIAISETVNRLAANETLDDAEVAALEARLDRLRTI